MGIHAQAVVLRPLAAACVFVLAHLVAAAHEATKPARRHLGKSTRPLDRGALAGTAGILKTPGELVIDEGRNTTCE